MTKLPLAGVQGQDQIINQLCINDTASAIRNVVDGTEQKMIKNIVSKSETKLHGLSQQLLQIQERERQRIASELHDGIGQSLSSIKFALESALRELHVESAETAQAKLTGIVCRVRDTIEEVRKISMDLRPAMLDDLGILATINWLCRESQSVHPRLKVIKDFDIQERDVSSALKVVIFRILQESLHNIAKHANASEVSVSLRRRGGEIRLTVKDNGRGFLVRDIDEPYGGFGLNSMKERAELSGGSLRVHSRPGFGTRVAASWPSYGSFTDARRRDNEI